MAIDPDMEPMLEEIRQRIDQRASEITDAFTAALAEFKIEVQEDMRALRADALAAAKGEADEAEQFFTERLTPVTAALERLNGAVFPPPPPPPPPEPDPEPEPEPETPAVQAPEQMGIRFGYGPAAGTTDDVLADAVAAAALPPLVTHEQGLTFWPERFPLPEGADPVKWRSTVAGMFTELHVRGRVGRALDAPIGFGERLLQFWSDHFTIVPDAIRLRGLAVSHREANIRPFMCGKFSELVKSASLSYSMADYLDQRVSAGEGSPANINTPTLGLNENLGREILELHTLGVNGPYTQDDVRALANLLAGLWVGSFHFRPYYAAPGDEVILGVTYPEESLAEIHRAMDDITRNPATARHIARKLVVHFLSDDPPAELVDAMADAYMANDTELLPVYRVLLDYVAARDLPHTKMRQPLDWMIAALKALSVTGADVEAVPSRIIQMMLTGMAKMNQPWDLPGGPDGWPEDAEAWLAPNQTAAFAEWSLTAPAAIMEQLNRPLPDVPTMLADKFRLTPHAATWIARAETTEDGICAAFLSTHLRRR